MSQLVPPVGWPDNRPFVADSDRSAEVSGFPRASPGGKAQPGFPAPGRAGYRSFRSGLPEPVKGVR
ncbi:hypothetical protein GCM10027452_33720 [Micromonospora halotolerans]